jgi:hypothetical protein
MFPARRAGDEGCLGAGATVTGSRYVVGGLVLWW